MERKLVSRWINHDTPLPIKHRTIKRSCFFEFVASYLEWNSGTSTTLLATATETTPARITAKLKAATE